MARHHSACPPANNDAKCEMPLIHALVTVLFADINPAFLYIKSRTSKCYVKKRKKHGKRIFVKALLVLTKMKIKIS